MNASVMRTLACAVLFGAAALPVHAQSASNPSPSPEPSEIGRVTTTDRQDEPLSRSSRPTYIIDRRQIESYGARTVAEALKLVPGVSLFQYGPFGAQTNYGVLGATSEQTLVLVNGFPVSAASTGSVDLGSFSTSGIARIEVVEGGGSTLYGTSAVGGIINIITGNAPRGPYALYSNGTLANNDTRLGFGVKGLSATFERHTAQNVYDYPAMDGFPAGTRTGNWAQSSAGRIDYRTPGNGMYGIDAGFGVQGVTVGIPGSLSFATPGASQATSYDDGHFTLMRHTPRSALNLSFSGSHQALAYTDPAFGENDTYDSRTQVSLRDVIGDDVHSMVAGIDLSRESAALFFGPASTPPEGSAALSQSALYAQYRGQLTQDGLFTIGLRGEHDSPQGSVLVPAFGAQARLGSFRLAGNYADSFRVPTIDDLFYPGFSNPNLQPERSHNLDFTLSTVVGGANVSLNWFDRNAVNLIQLDSSFVPQNVAQAKLAGFVLSAKVPAFSGMVATLGVTNLYRALNLTPGQPQSRLNFEPAFTTLLGLERQLGPHANVGFGVQARVVSPYADEGAVNGGATTVDAFVRGRLAPEAVLTLRAKNLGNERFSPIIGYPAPGRTVDIELSTR